MMAGWIIAFAAVVAAASIGVCRALRRPRAQTPAGAVSPADAARERERIEAERKERCEEIRERHDAARKDVDKWWT